MILCLLIISTMPRQLTWYELYERGEKYYEKAEYVRCVEDMEAALKLKDSPARNQFTRAVQKIDYKPFYYLALAHDKQDNLAKAYEFAQKAYQGEVVRQLPILQSDLAHILTKWRDYISKESAGYQQELEIIQTRTRIMTLLRDGDLSAASDLLSDVAQPDKYGDLKLQLDTRQELKGRTEQLYRDLSQRIEKLLGENKPQLAQALFDEVSDSLPAEARSRLAQQLAAVPEPTPEETPAPAETVVEEQPPLVDSMGPTAQEEAERFRKMEKDLMEQTAALRAELAEMSDANLGLQRRLAERKDDTVSFAPQPLLVLKAAGRSIRVEGHAVSPMRLTAWQLLLNEQPVPTPAIGNPQGNDYSLNATVNVDGYGEHEITFEITDEVGGKAQITRSITLVRPFYLNPFLWAVIVGLLLIGFGLRFSAALRRKRRAMLTHFNPYIAGSPVRSYGMFYGRDALMHRIQGLVHKNSFMIHGARRIGKTSMLLQLKKNLGALESPEYKFFPAFIDLQGVREDDLFHHMMDELLSHRDDWGIEPEGLLFREGDQEKYLARQFSKDIKRLINILQERESVHIQVVLLMDEVDVLNEFSEKTNQKLRGIFMKDFAEHLSCVMAGIHLKKEWDSAGSPWYNFFEQIPVDAFSEEDAEALILDPVKGIFSYEKEAVTLIVEDTACHPYLIQKVCVSLIGDKLKQGNYRITKKDATEALERLNEEIQRNTHELHHQSMG